MRRHIKSVRLTLLSSILVIVALLFAYAMPAAMAEPSPEELSSSSPDTNAEPQDATPNDDADSQTAVYLDGSGGNDDNDGKTPGSAVKTFSKAKALVQSNPDLDKIVVVGTTPVSGDIDLVGSPVKVVRADGFNGYLFTISRGDTASLTDIVIDGNSDVNSAIEKSLINVESGATLQIGDGAVLRNNKLNVSSSNDRGGAIFSYGGAIKMTGGVIEDNLAVNGGGIYLLNATMELSGGVIQRNTARRVTDEAGVHSAGGGICADKGSTVRMSGSALIQSNHSDEVGGGISAGSRQWGPSNIFQMDGGEIKDNTSEATGGGLFIQAKYFSGGASKGYLNAGRITGNRMLGKGKTNFLFGGGGIYVNGANDLYGANGANGELYIKNVLISDNQSVQEGAGYAACPISKTTINVTDGVGMKGNARTDQSEKGRELYLLASQKYGLHSGRPDYDLAERMLGGVPYDWKLADGTLLPKESYKGTLEDNQELPLHTDSAANDLTGKLAKVIIADNYSATRGGGIGSNGSVIFGTSEELVEVSVEKQWVDQDNAEKLRPETVTVRLTATVGDISGVVETRRIGADTDWKTTFSNLPKTHDGQEIVYSIEEYPAGVYSSQVKKNSEYSFTLVNTLTFTDIAVSKKWEDNENTAGVRPDSVTVKLLADGAETGKQIVLDESTGWTGLFTNLPEYRDDKKINYSVAEIGVANGYVSLISGSAEKGYVVTNTYEPPTEPTTTEPTTVPATTEPSTGPTSGTTTEPTTAPRLPKTGVSVSTWSGWAGGFALAGAFLLIVAVQNRKRN